MEGGPRGKYIRSWWFEEFTFFVVVSFPPLFFLFGFDFSECVCCRASCSPVGMRYAFHRVLIGFGVRWILLCICSALFSSLEGGGDSSFLGGLVCKSELMGVGWKLHHMLCISLLCAPTQALLALILPHHSIFALHWAAFIHYLIEWCYFFVVVYCMFLPSKDKDSVRRGSLFLLLGYH